MITYQTKHSHPTDEPYRQYNENLSFGLHLHNSFEFFCVFDGEVNIVIDGKKYTVSKNQGTFIFPNQIHSYETKNHSKSFLSIFSIEIVQNFNAKIKNKSAVSPIFDLPTDETVDLLQKSDNYFYFLSSLYKLIAIFDSNTEYTKKDATFFDNYDKILTFIRENYTKQITVKDVSKELGYDYHYLSNLIQKVFHTTFRKILNEYRISYAQHLLKSTNMQISEIADKCGYESICSFNRNFKIYTDTYPTDFKKKNN